MQIPVQPPLQTRVAPRITTKTSRACPARPIARARPWKEAGDEQAGQCRQACQRASQTALPHLLHTMLFKEATLSCLQ